VLTRSRDRGFNNPLSELNHQMFGALVAPAQSNQRKRITVVA
jgi:hypothetical protein